MQLHNPTVIRPIPDIQDFSAKLEGSKIFSIIDLIREYDQVPVAEAGICKTAVITSFGLFEFLRMSFGLTKHSIGILMRDGFRLPLFRPYVCVFG